MPFFLYLLPEDVICRNDHWLEINKRAVNPERDSIYLLGQLGRDLPGAMQQ